MGGNRLREVLNRLRWDPEMPGDGVVLHHSSRVAGRDAEVVVAFERVADVLAEGVLLADGTFLPYHRLVAVTRGTETLWRATVEEDEP